MSEEKAWWEERRDRRLPPPDWGDGIWPPDLDEPDERYAIMINDRLWKRNGVVVTYNNYDSASQSAWTISRKYNTGTQVIAL